MDKNFKVKFNFVSNVLVLLLIVFGGLVWADTNGIWHLAEDVRPGIFGSDEGIISGYSFVNPLSLNSDTTYKGVELDARYVNEAQANSVSSGMIVDGSIGIVDVNSAQIQARVSGTCPAGQSIRAISSTGTVTCEVDDSGISSESDTLQSVTNRGAITTQVISTPKITDYNNVGYYVDPASVSYLSRVRSANGGSPAYSDELVTKSYVDSAIASGAGGLSGYEIKVGSLATGGGWTYVYAWCSAGKVVLGGGCGTVHASQNADYPVSQNGLYGWYCGTYNLNVPATWYAYAICVYP